MSYRYHLTTKVSKVLRFKVPICSEDDDTANNKECDDTSIMDPIDTIIDYLNE